MSIKQKIVMPDFEADQQDAMKKTTNIHSLADQVEALEFVNRNIEGAEENLKDLKKKRDHISGEVIPTMMSEMGLAELKLHDGSHLKVSTTYRATITEANKEAAFNWLRNNGLGDISKMRYPYPLVATKITRQLIMLLLHKSVGFNRHKS